MPLAKENVSGFKNVLNGIFALKEKQAEVREAEKVEQQKLGLAKVITQLYLPRE